MDIASPVAAIIKEFVNAIGDREKVSHLSPNEGIADKARELELAADKNTDTNDRLRLLNSSIDHYMVFDPAKAALLLERVGWMSEGGSRKRYFQRAVRLYKELGINPDEYVFGNNEYLSPDEELYLVARLRKVEELERLSEWQTA